jgi:hypothetical protein
MNEPPSEASDRGDEGALPPKRKPVLDHCGVFTCLAYRDADGKWRDHYRGHELEGTVRILKNESASSQKG